MVNYETTKQADALENHLCKALDKCKIFPMNKEDSEMLVQMIFLKRKGFEENCEKDLKDVWQFQALIKRAELYLTAKFDRRILFLLLMICDGSIGMMIMYLYYTQYKAKQKGIKDIDLQDFCEIYPMGFFSNEDLSRIWDDCKVERKSSQGSDNLIDYGTASLSIQFEDLIVKQESEEQTETTSK